MNTVPDGFRHHIAMTVRFADLDAMGHVNNARYLTYIEQGRILYAQEVYSLKFGDWAEMGMILAKITVDFRLPLSFGDEITVFTRCSRLGHKSFDLSSVILTAENAVAATGEATMVGFDYHTNQTVAVPDTWRQQIQAYEPALDAG